MSLLRASAPQAAWGDGQPTRVVWGLDNLGFGGTELNAIRVAERIDRTRVELSMICLGGDGPMGERYERAGVPIFHFPISSLYGASTLRQGLRLFSFLRRQQVDVFHSHDIYSNIFALFWARLAGVPRVIGSRRWWLGPARRAHQIANRWAYRFAHQVVINSNSVAELMENTEGVARDRIAYIPNFVEEHAFRDLSALERAEWRRSVGLPVSAAVVGIVANLRPEKDHPTLLRAVHILISQGLDLHLAIVGEGRDHDSLRALAADLEIEDQVTFTGHLPSRPNLHQMFDVTVLSSLTEAFPNTLLEAMAAGRPVVATNVGGIPDLITHDENGLLVRPADPQALAGALEILLTRKELLRDYGRKGRDRAARDFREDEILAQWHRLYSR